MEPLGFPLRVLTLTVCTYLLRWTFDLQRIPFSRFHAPGKRPDGARRAFILTTVTLIFVKHVVRRQKLLCLLSSNLTWI